MSHFHIVDLHRRTDGGKTRSQTRPTRKASPKTSTFLFDDDLTTYSEPYTFDPTYTTKISADNVAEDKQFSHAEGQDLSTRRELAKKGLIPNALRITKTPVYEEIRTSPLPTMRLQLGQQQQQQQQLQYQQQQQSYNSREDTSFEHHSSLVNEKTSPDSAISFGRPQTSHMTNVETWTENSPRLVRKASEVTPRGHIHTHSGSIDWTAVKPSRQSQQPPQPLRPRVITPPDSPGPLYVELNPYNEEMDAENIMFDMQQPTPPPEPQNIPMRSDSLVKQVTPRSSDNELSISGELAPPSNPISIRQTPQVNHGRHPSITRSLSVNDVGEEQNNAGMEAIPELRHLMTPPRPTMERPNRTSILSEAIRELNARSSAHFERYTKLRQSRQKLHSEIIAALHAPQARPKEAKTMSQLQLEMASVDAGIDDCMAKQSALEKKRQKCLEELLTLVQQPMTTRNTPSRGSPFNVFEAMASPKPSTSYGSPSPAMSPPVASNERFVQQNNVFASPMSASPSSLSSSSLLPSPTPGVLKRGLSKGLMLTSVKNFLDGSS